MRAREFTINVPITIKINGDGDPEIEMDNADELDQDPVMMSPLQQELELKKSEQGKRSPYIDTMLDDDPEIGDSEGEPEEIGAYSRPRTRKR